MVCRPGDPCYSLTGKVIKGRSVPGYDLITQPQSLGGAPAKSGTIVYNGAVQSGVPKTEAERMATHYARYGTTNLPPRGTGFAGQQKLQNGEFSWGTLVAGGIIGLIFGYLIFAQSGRQIGYEAGQRVARKIKG